VGEQRFVANRYSPPPKLLALALFAQLNLSNGLHRKILQGDRLTLTLLTGALGEREAEAIQHRFQELNGVLHRLRNLQLRDLFQPLLQVASSLTLTVTR